MRVPHAAKTLTEQVQERYKRATSAPVGEPDGLGVYRTVKFDKPSSKWLAKILPELDDPRIVGHDMNAGQVEVTFDHRPLADSREPFPLDEADTVASASE